MSERDLFPDDQAYIAFRRTLAEQERQQRLAVSRAQRKKWRPALGKRVRRALKTLRTQRYIARLRADPAKYAAYLERRRIYFAKWRAANPERYRVIRRRYYQKMAWYIRGSNAARYAAHRKEIRAQQHTYYVAHREEILARLHTYREEHREEKAAYNRSYRTAHREEIAAQKRAYRMAHREEILAHDAAYRAAKKAQRQKRDEPTG